MKFDESIIHKIKYLCREIPKEEWSGVLFYDIEGSITDPTNMIITLKDVFPMQKGVAAYTEYMFNEELIDYRMSNPTTNFMRIGHMHSHNVMNTFFSGTDTSELNDNSEFHNYYLSVIVNNYFDVCARVAFRGNQSIRTFSCKNEDGEEYKLSLPSTEEVLFYYECEIVRDQPNFVVHESFISRVKHIISEALRFKSTNLPVNTSITSHNTNHMKADTDNTNKNQPVQLPGTNRRYLSDYLPEGFNLSNKSENKNNHKEVSFEFVNDEYLASQENIVYDSDIDEEDDLDDQTNMMEDLLIDILLSYPRIQREYQIYGDQLTLLDDVFAFIRPRVGKGTRDEYIKYVIERIPIEYMERFTTDSDEFDNDYLIMIQLVGDLKEDYTNAQFLYPEMISFLQKFRDAK